MTNKTLPVFVIYKHTKDRDMSDIVVLVDRSAGNETVGEMWTETYVFSKHASLEDVLKKISGYEEGDFIGWTMPKSLNNVRIQVAQ